MKSSTFPSINDYEDYNVMLAKLRKETLIYCTIKFPYQDYHKLLIELEY